MHIKDKALSNGSFIIKDGTSTRFWEDTWLGDKPLKDNYASLYHIARDKKVTISKVMSSIPLNISFRRSLMDNNLRQWLHLVARVSNVVLVDGKDYFRWQLTKNGLFTVRSMYQDVLDTHPPFQHRKIWKSWNQNLSLVSSEGCRFNKTQPCEEKKNWKGSQKCVCCNLNETIQHLFLDCPFAKMIWRLIFLCYYFEPT
jgi:hypothetical protein